jgi:hypothetical protein
VLFLIANGDDGGGLSARTREAVLAAVTVPDDPSDEPAPRGTRAASAVALRAALAADPPAALTPSETALLSEWLDRLTV